MRQIFYNGRIYASVDAAGADERSAHLGHRALHGGLNVDGACTDIYEVIDTGAVIVDDGRITAVVREFSQPYMKRDGAQSTVEWIDLEGRSLVPGFVDVHVHGGEGCDVMSGDGEQLVGMSRFHAAHGTTSLLATTLTGDRTNIERAIDTIVDAAGREPMGAQFVGIHLEGPFINPLRAGAQHPEHIRIPTADELDAYIARSHGLLRMMTIAPEIPGAMDAIGYAAQRGVTVSIGHTDATFDVVREAVRNGATHVTHLFNGMRPLHHREPGAAGAALMIDELTVELICDGIHVHPELVAHVYRVKPPDRIVLITDAVAAAGLPDGDAYELGGLHCYKTAGQVRLSADHSLAGSCLTMDTALRNALSFTGRSLADILPSLTLYPARQAGIDECKGSIAPGKDADLVVLDADYMVKATYVRGRRVFPQ